LSEEELTKALGTIRSKLFDVRKKRIHPLKNDKILTDWNGLMIAAFAKAARVFDDENYTQIAIKAADFILSEMTGKDGKLLHRYREGEKSITANLDDYTFLIWGLLELYETTFNAKYLEKSLKLNEVTLKHFWDDKEGGFYFIPNYGEKLLIREKQIYDGATPSGNSAAVLNLLKLSRLTSNPDYEEKANMIVQFFAKQLYKTPYAYTQLLMGLDFALGPSFEVVIVGDLDEEDTNEMISALREDYIPNKVVLFKPEKNEEEITNIVEILKEYKTIDGKSTAYVCQEFVCKKPTNDIQIMLNQLREGEKEN